jgi:hypothetical protein
MAKARATLNRVRGQEGGGSLHPSGGDPGGGREGATFGEREGGLQPPEAAPLQETTGGTVLKRRRGRPRKVMPDSLPAIPPVQPGEDGLDLPEDENDRDTGRPARRKGAQSGWLNDYNVD